jgi:hypothetical protein
MADDVAYKAIAGNKVRQGYTVSLAPAGTGISLDRRGYSTDDVDIGSLDNRFFESRHSVASDDDVAIADSGNKAAVITYPAAGVGRRHVIGGLYWSYIGTNPVGQVKLEDGAGNIVFTTGIVGAGNDSVIFSDGKRGSENTAMIATLTAGGAGVSGIISVTEHVIE